MEYNNMIITIDSESGQLTLTPDSETDRQLILALIDCEDLSQFSEYVAYHKLNITTDLRVPADTIKSYPANGQPVSLEIGLSEDRDSTKTETAGSLYVGNLIGFNRDSTLRDPGV